MSNWRAKRRTGDSTIRGDASPPAAERIGLLNFLHRWTRHFPWSAAVIVFAFLALAGGCVSRPEHEVTCIQVKGDTLRLMLCSWTHGSQMIESDDFRSNFHYAIADYDLGAADGGVLKMIGVHSLPADGGLDDGGDHGDGGMRTDEVFPSGFRGFSPRSWTLDKTIACEGGPLLPVEARLSSMVRGSAAWSDLLLLVKAPQRSGAVRPHARQWFIGRDGRYAVAADNHIGALVVDVDSLKPLDAPDVLDMITRANALTPKVAPSGRLTRAMTYFVGNRSDTVFVLRRDNASVMEINREEDQLRLSDAEEENGGLLMMFTDNAAGNDFYSRQRSTRIAIADLHGRKQYQTEFPRQPCKQPGIFFVPVIAGWDVDSSLVFLWSHRMGPSYGRLDDPGAYRLQDLAKSPYVLNAWNYKTGQWTTYRVPIQW